MWGHTDRCTGARLRHEAPALGRRQVPQDGGQLVRCAEHLQRQDAARLRPGLGRFKPPNRDHVLRQMIPRPQIHSPSNIKLAARSVTASRWPLRQPCMGVMRRVIGSPGPDRPRNRTLLCNQQDPRTLARTRLSSCCVKLLRMAGTRSRSSSARCSTSSASYSAKLAWKAARRLTLLRMVQHSTAWPVLRASGSAWSSF
jgi:hypothetical protein